MSFIPQVGQVPGSALTTSGCIGHVHDDAAMGMSFIPHVGQVPGSALTTSGCIGHVHDDAAVPWSP
jgi:hypothetical protein